jgi:hypothetical protein
MKNKLLSLILGFTFLSSNSLAVTTTGKATDSRDWAACSLAFYQAFTQLGSTSPATYQVKIDPIQNDPKTRRYSCSLTLVTDSVAPEVRVNQQASWIETGYTGRGVTLEKACLSAEIKTFSETLRMNYGNQSNFTTLDFSVLKDRVYEQGTGVIYCTVTRKMRKNLLWTMKNIVTTSTAGATQAESCALAKSAAETQSKGTCAELGLRFIQLRDTWGLPAQTASFADGWKCDYSGYAYCHE